MHYILKFFSFFRFECLQGLYFGLYKLLLFLMNYGGGSDYKSSGECSALQHIFSKEKKNIIIFDVGANIGGYTNMCINIFGSSLQEIHSFEPSKSTLNDFLKNVEKRNNLIVNNFGLGEREENLLLYSAQYDSGGASLYNRDLSHINIQSNITEEVHISTLDAYMTKNKIQKITLLKLDVEGFEVSVLKGGLKAIKEGAIKYIQFEFGGTGIDARIYFKDFWLLLSPQYNLYRILPNSIYHIKKYEEQLEIFTCVNFLCILKEC